MKILFKISRVFLIFFIWTMGYAFWFQRLMLSQWGFNPIVKAHWDYIWNDWKSGGLVFQTFREWMFLFTLCAMIPFWFSGLIALCAVPWFKWLKFVLLFPIRLIKSKMKEKQREKNAVKPKVTKKKSYKQTRPPAVRSASGRIKKSDDKPLEQDALEPKTGSFSAAPEPSYTSSHSPSPTPSSSSNTPSSGSGTSSGSIMETLRGFGYRLISDAKIAGKKVDFVGVCDNHLLLCLVDSEPGDWLADEERFNDEEPLWFSESNHRISPVRLNLNARDALQSKLSGATQGMQIKPIVIIRQGTIINAEDMFEVWSGLNVIVCRHDEGGPDEIKEISQSLSHVNAPNEELFHSISSILS